jgi:hypothetical protein
MTFSAPTPLVRESVDTAITGYRTSNPQGELDQSD